MAAPTRGQSSAWAAIPTRLWRSTRIATGSTSPRTPTSPTAASTAGRRRAASSWVPACSPTSHRTPVSSPRCRSSWTTARFCGPTFTADGKVLFVNMQDPGLTGGDGQTVVNVHIKFQVEHHVRGSADDGHDLDPPSRSRRLRRDRTRCPRCPASRGTTRCLHRQAVVARVPRRARPVVCIRPQARPGALHPRARCRPARQDAPDS